MKIPSFIKLPSFLKKRKDDEIVLAFLISVFIGTILLQFFLRTIPQSCQCPTPSSWTLCNNVSQQRINYRCDSSTNYMCQEFTEFQSCTVNFTITIASNS